MLLVDFTNKFTVFFLTNITLLTIIVFIKIFITENNIVVKFINIIKTIIVLFLFNKCNLCGIIPTTPDSNKNIRNFADITFLWIN